jgi:tRNA A-37 threonylcarbamoyl transferase component Bud32
MESILESKKKDELKKAVEERIHLYQILNESPYFLHMLGTAAESKGVFESVQGENLQRLLDMRVEFTTEHLLFYLWQLVQAVVHLHTNGIVHQDIQLSNIFIQLDTNAVKLLSSSLLAKGSMKKDILAVGQVMFELLRRTQVMDHLKNLIAKCCSEKEEERPSIQDISQQLLLVIHQQVKESKETIPKEKVALEVCRVAFETRQKMFEHAMADYRIHEKEIDYLDQSCYIATRLFLLPLDQQVGRQWSREEFSSMVYKYLKDHCLLQERWYLTNLSKGDLDKLFDLLFCVKAETNKGVSPCLMTLEHVCHAFLYLNRENIDGEEKKEIPLSKMINLLHANLGYLPPKNPHMMLSREGSENLLKGSKDQMYVVRLAEGHLSISSENKKTFHGLNLVLSFKKGPQAPFCSDLHAEETLKKEKREEVVVEHLELASTAFNEKQECFFMDLQGKPHADLAFLSEIFSKFQGAT